MDEYIQEMTPSGSGKKASVNTDSVEVMLLDDDKIDAEGHMLLSCLVMWCCNICFGLMAFFVANSSRHKSYEKMRRLIKISRYLNVVGVLVTCIILSVFLALYFTHNLGNYLPYKRVE
ncbi:hypothetical protein LSH36_682g00032 [Paralvinella palmiformis]|uniref:Uncharacterized protein n=1 Tax=Paralvinella palmiformis TaxID=53620 RepID=A0AAD9J3I4_9ANNE|nr:hypothetical protein LSH36_682g00032 [Paralvinella palmiformis]